MKQNMVDVGLKIIDQAEKNNVDAEIFVMQEKELNIGLYNGQVESLKQAKELGIGLTVIKQGKKGFAYSTEFSSTALEQLFQNALQISEFNAPNEYNVLPQGGYIYPQLNIYDEDIKNITLQEKVDLLRQGENEAKNYNYQIKSVERAGYSEKELNVLIMNSNGINTRGKVNYFSIFLSVLAENKYDKQNGFFLNYQRKFRNLKPDIIAREAARRAARGLNARTIKTGVLPCILEAGVVARFIGFLAAILSADTVQKGKSMLANKLGEGVASPLVNIIDDATDVHGMACFPFDGEGVASQRNQLVTKGILQGFLYDTMHAARCGVKSTGSARRASFRSLPVIGSSNLLLAPGQDKLDKLISEIDRGLYVTDIMGMHTVNPISGDFSLGAAGIMIEKGQLTYPVQGITIAGNIIPMFMNIEAIADDFRYFGSRGAAAVRIPSLSIGGE